ncbi:hypothetical protein L195_g061114, partial [Trifolium pratense]
TNPLQGPSTRGPPSGFGPRHTSPLLRPAQPQAYLTGGEGSSTHASQLWYPDSGATHHVTNNSDNLLDSVSLSGSDQVLLGNGQ